MQFCGCGRCEPCIGTAASRWSSRARHEASGWKFIYLLTLTFRDDAYPASQAELEHRVVKYVKSVREAREGETLRTIGCTELGDRTRRPHGHIALFCDRAFELGAPVATGARGDLVHECGELSKSWAWGHVGVNGGPSNGMMDGLSAYVVAHQSEPGLGRMMLCEHERELVHEDGKPKLRPVARAVFLKFGETGEWLPVADGWLHHPEGGLFVARNGARRGAWRVDGRPFERRRQGRREGDSLSPVDADARLRVRVHWYEETHHPLTGEAHYFRPSASVCRSRGLGYEWADRYGLASCEAGALIDRGGVRLPLPGSIRRRVTRDMTDAQREALGAEARAAVQAAAVERGATPGGWDTTPERRAVQLDVYRARKASKSAGRGAV